MPRIAPSIPYTCYVCGTAFTISNEGVQPFDPASMAQLQQPVACPCCGAPEKHAPYSMANAGIILVGTFFGENQYRENYGSAEGYLLNHLFDSERIDEAVRQATQLDYAAWESSTRAALTDADADERRLAREELALITKARAAAANGTLIRELGELAARVKAQLAQEREGYMARYRQHCGAGQRPPAVVYRFAQ